jgi:hypothetical protein
MRCGYRVIWVVSAIASVLSARYILVESNFHYPLILLLAQLSVTAVVDDDLRNVRFRNIFGASFAGHPAQR